MREFALLWLTAERRADAAVEQVAEVGRGQVGVADDCVDQAMSSSAEDRPRHLIVLLAGGDVGLGVHRSDDTCGSGVRGVVVDEVVAAQRRSGAYDPKIRGLIGPDNHGVRSSRQMW